MKKTSLLTLAGLAWGAAALPAPLPAAAPSPTMRPVVRGRAAAITSMKAEATRAAELILLAGGNAFDALVTGQAVLGIADAANNGVGSDAVILVYDARAGKVWSLNAEGTAPRLASIEWYEKNHGGKLTTSRGWSMGSIGAIVIDLETGVLSAGADPRVEAYAWAW
jgi:gamma-glutamyltranspeptidase